jgi:hypothetical protein
MNVEAPEICARHVGSKTQKENFLENAFNDFDYILLFYEECLKYNYIFYTIRKIMIRAPRSQTRNVSSSEIFFIGRADLIVVRYSVASKRSTGQQSTLCPR